MNKKRIKLALLLALVSAVAIPAYAREDEQGDDRGRSRGGENRMMALPEVREMVREAVRPEVIGTVTSVSGNTIVVLGKGFDDRRVASSTFTVDASNALVIKGSATSTVSSIAAGDHIFVQGSMTSSTTVSAKLIRDLGERQDLQKKTNKNKNSDDSDDDSQQSNKESNKRGVFSRLGSFFRGMFGFWR